MTTSVKDIDKGYKHIVAELGKIDKIFVKVGLQGDEKYDGGESVVDIAVKNEFGTEKIPSRPFMRQTFEKYNLETNAIIAQQLELIYFKGKNAAQALAQVGTWYEGKMKHTVAHGEFIANTQFTIRNKGSSRPLIDTGRMRQSIRYVVTHV